MQVRALMFQVLFSLFALAAIVNVIGKRKSGQLSIRGMVFWILFWLGATGVVLLPDSATIVANLFGIGRGTDFVLYVSIAIIFFVLFRLHIKIENMNRDVTRVVRDKALK